MGGCGEGGGRGGVRGGQSMAGRLESYDSVNKTGWTSIAIDARCIRQQVAGRRQVGR